MRDPAGIIHTGRDAYEFYRSRHPDTAVSYLVFQQVCKSYFTGIVNLLLTGWRWAMGHHLGSVYIIKVKRRFSKPMPNWGATMKLRQSRPDKPEAMVYFTNQPFWYRFHWTKHECAIPNKSVYRFDTTQGPQGNSRKIPRLLESSPFAHLNFPLYEKPPKSAHGVQDRFE